MVTAYVFAGRASDEFLGPKPVLEWVLDSVRGARGVDRVVVVSARPGSCPENANCLVIDGVAPQDHAKVLQHDAVADEHVVFVDPGAVFISSGSIERAVSQVVDLNKPVAFTGRTISALTQRPMRPLDVVVVLSGCRAYQRSAVGRPVSDGALVDVDEYEALDATTEAGLTLARALVESGGR